MSQSRRVRVAVGVALLAGTLALATWAGGSPDGSDPARGRDRSAGADARPGTGARPDPDDTATAPTEPSPDTSGGPAGTATGRSYLTIGTNDQRQFTEEEYETIASGYDTVVFTKFHGGWDIVLHHEAARRLKELNPDLRVFGYMSTKYWFDAFTWGDADIDPAWLLRDNDGELVPNTAETYDLESRTLGYYVDPSNPEYRAWLVEVARSWMAAAPYDGIRLDAASPIGDFGDRDVRRWAELLGDERVDAYNEGIRTLFLELKEAVAPGEILFNGISPSPIRGPERDLPMLDYTDGAMDENFCTSANGEFHDIVEDIEIMERFPDEALHLRARYGADLSDAERRRVERVCVASFLMGWQPGSTYLNVGTNYSVAQLAERPPELTLDLGPPVGGHQRDGELLSRDFAGGTVYVNLGAADVTVEVPADLVLVDGDDRSPVPGGSLTVASEDAAFLTRNG